ncbi:MAG: hypothetical protein EBS05_25710 [Proteobacteria bacterium]|nr:hypothetical protein [Pseudomonadota bacterium]
MAITGLIDNQAGHAGETMSLSPTIEVVQPVLLQQTTPGYIRVCWRNPKRDAAFLVTKVGAGIPRNKRSRVDLIGNELQ